MNYLLEQAWIQALGWTLLHATWQASLVALTWALTRRFLRKASSHQRYLLAISALGTLLLCSGITFWKVYPDTLSNSTAAVAMNSLTLPNLEAFRLADFKVNPAEQDWQDILHVAIPWLSVIWMLGAMLMGARLSLGFWYLNNLRSQGLHALEQTWQHRAESIAHKMGLSRTWKLWESERVTEPLTLGHLKPIILIPVGMLSGLNPDQVEAILAHEFAHIYRADFLFNLIQSLIEILFFFHPAVWWLSREIRRERELCCDDLAVATLGDAYTYAEALTRLQSFCHSPKHFLTMQAKGNSGSFTARIHRLFTPASTKPSIWKSLSAAILLTLGIMGSGYYAYTQSNEYLQLQPPSTEQADNFTQDSEEQEGIKPIETFTQKQDFHTEVTEKEHAEEVEEETQAEQNILARFVITPKLSDKKFEKFKRKFAQYKLAQSPTITRNGEGKIVDLFFLSKKDCTHAKMGIKNFSRLKIEIRKGKEGKPVLGLKDPIGNPYYIQEEVCPPLEIKQEQELPVLVYLDGKSLDFFEGGINEVLPELIRRGKIKAYEDIGKVSLYAIENGDFTPFIKGENFPPPPPKSVSKPEPHPKKFNIYVLNTWEYLAEKFEKEGKAKHRLYILNENIVGFKKGEIGPVAKELIASSGLDKSKLKAFKINAKDTYEKYKVRAVEVVEITFADNLDSKKPIDCENCDEAPKLKEALKVKTNWKFETEKGNYEVDGQIKYPNNFKEAGQELQNFFFFDGKPLGYKSGDIFEVIAQELSERNLKKIGGIVICDADKSAPEAGNVVQILSEEYEAEYYRRLKEKKNKVLELETLDPNTEIYLDGEVVSQEVLKQIDPAIINTINVMGPTSEKGYERNEERGPVVVIRTKVSIEKPKIATKFNFDQSINLEPAVALKLDVSPNPSPGRFNINFELDQKVEVKFSVRDLQGKVIHKGIPKTYEAGSQKIIWNAEDEANGVYLIQLETKEGIITNKRVILKR